MMKFSLLVNPLHQIRHKTPPNISSWSVVRAQPYATSAQLNFTTLDKSCTHSTRASTTSLSSTLKTVTSSSWKTAYKTFCLRSNPCQRFRLIKITGRFMKTHFDWWPCEGFFLGKSLRNWWFWEVSLDDNLTWYFCFIFILYLTFTQYSNTFSINIINNIPQYHQ